MVSSFLRLRLHLGFCQHRATIGSIEQLQEFFKGTFIQKQVGYIPDEMEAFYEGQERAYAKGFNPSWSMYRFHHVCVRGGGDGLYAGLEGIPQPTMATTGLQLPQSFACLLSHVTCVTYVHRSNLVFIFHIICK